MRRAALLLTTAVFAVAGCGGDDDDDSGNRSAQEVPAPAQTAPTDEGGGTVVDMNDQLTFEPKEIEVSVGEEVTWMNIGKIAHTVTADKSKAADPALVSIPAGTKEWDSGFVNENESFSHTFEKAGTYRYICIPHEGAGMVGTVVVK
jgi:plastocyanin